MLLQFMNYKVLYLKYTLPIKQLFSHGYISFLILLSHKRHFCWNSSKLSLLSWLSTFTNYMLFLNCTLFLLKYKIISSIFKNQPSFQGLFWHELLKINTDMSDSIRSRLFYMFQTSKPLPSPISLDPFLFIRKLGELYLLFCPRVEIEPLPRLWCWWYERNTYS